MARLLNFEVPKLTFEFGNTDNKRKNRIAYYMGQNGKSVPIVIYCSDKEYKQHCDYLGLSMEFN